MALTQEEINKIRTGAGAQPIAQTAAPSLSSRLGLNEPSPTFAGLKQGTESIPAEIAKNTGEAYKKAVPNFLSEAGRNDNSTSANPIIRTGENALAATASGLNTVFAPIGETVSTLTKRASESSPAAAGALNGALADKVNALRTSHPEAARNIDNALAVILSIVGEKPATKLANTAADTVVATGERALNKIETAVKGTPEEQALKTKGKTQVKVSKIASEWQQPTTLNKPAFNNARQALEQAPETPQFLAEHKLSPSSHIEDGKYATADSAQALRDTAAKMSHETLRPSLQMADYTTPKTPVSDIVKSAIEEARNTKHITAGNLDNIIENIKHEGESLAKKYPDGMNLTEMHDNKVTYSKNAGYSPFNDPKINNAATSNRSVGTALQKTVETKAPADVPVNDFNSYLSKYYKGADYLDALNGKTAPVSFGKQVARGVSKFAGAAIGGKFGGSIVSQFAGYQIGKAVEHAMENLSNPAKEAFLKNLKITNPEAYRSVAEFIGKKNAEAATILKLPAPSPLGSSKNPIITPAPTTYEKSAGQSFRTSTNKTGDQYVRDLKTGKLKIIPKSPKR